MEAGRQPGVAHLGRIRLGTELLCIGEVREREAEEEREGKGRGGEPRRADGGRVWTETKRG